MAALALAGCSPDSGTDALGNHYPEVLAWSCDPNGGVAPLTTTCTWQIRDVDNERIACTFDVGADANIEKSIDDCPGTGSAPFTLTTPGNAVIRLTLTDWRGASSNSDTNVAVAAPPNAPPSIVSYAATPLMGGSPLPVTFTFGVADTDGDALTCRLLEGMAELVPASPCGANETRVAALIGIGQHVVTLEVSDGKGGRATKDLTFQVSALPQVGDLRISKIEWAQTVVSQNPRLVSGKDALLRVYVLSERAGVTGVTVTVDATNNGAVVGSQTLTGPGAAPTTENPNDLTQQWRTTIPAAWVAPGLSLKVKVDPLNQLGESDETNNDQVVTPAVGTGNVLPVTHVPVVQSGRTGSPKQIDQAMQQIWPVKALDNKSRAAYTFSGTIAANGSGWDTLLNQLSMARQSDGSRRDYLGWISVAFGSGVAGLGYVGIGAAITRDDDVQTPVHELGHNMSRDHAPCGGATGVDPNYPVSTAHLDVQGYDPTQSRLISAAQTYDIMSYCDPVWVSQYNYKGAQSFLESRPISPTTSLISLPRITVAGQLQHGHLTLQPITLIEGPADPELEPGEYTLTLYGERTVSVPFAMNRVADGLDDAQFSLLVPAVPGLYAVTVSLGGKTLAARVAGKPQPPQRPEARTVPGGIELTWDAAAFPYASVSHLGPSGHTTLSLWAEGGKAFVSTAGLDDGGAFEVSLSDGVQSQRVVLAR
jgi:hypothetical protein